MNASSEVTGIWDMTLRTPIGSLAVVYTFTGTPGTPAGTGGDLTGTAGTLAGTAEGRGETVALTDIACEETAAGLRVTWRQSVTKPMRLNLEFDVTVAGDTLTGHSRAGRLPRTGVTGVRRPG